MLRAKSKPTTELIPAGARQAICIWVIDMGTHFSPIWNKEAHKCGITWEIPSVRIDVDDNGVKKSMPRVRTVSYTLSSHEKSNLRKMITGWMDPYTPQEAVEGYDIHSLIGQNCLLTIVHELGKDSNTYANVAGVSPLVDGMPAKMPENPTIAYSIREDGMNIPDGMPDWIVGEIQKSNEWKQMEHAGGVLNAPADAQNYTNNPSGNMGQIDREAPADDDGLPF